MAYWLITIIFAYLLFSLSSLSDKLALGGGSRQSFNAVSYTFYVGLFGLLYVFLIPFADFGFPDFKSLCWIIFDSFVRIGAVFAMYAALKKFDVSKVLTTIGAMQIIFVFVLSVIFWGIQIIFQTNILAFVVLFLGSIIISFTKTIKMTGEYLKITLLSAFLFSLDYISLKFIFLGQPFLQGIIWIGLFNFAVVMLLLLKQSYRKEIFEKKIIADKKNQVFFLCAQGCGGLGIILQNFAISLVPVAFLPMLNALRGVQYIFLLIIAFFVSFAFPGYLKEELTKNALLQKILSVVLIATGLALLSI